MDIISIIKDVGFPIGAFLIMTWMNVTVIKENTKAISELTRTLAEKEET